MGDWDVGKIDEYKEKYPHEERYVSQIIRHEYFNPGNLYNDVALLILSEPLYFGKNPAYGSICLPQHGENFFGQ